MLEDCSVDCFSSTLGDDAAATPRCAAELESGVPGCDRVAEEEELVGVLTPLPLLPALLLVLWRESSTHAMKSSRIQSTIHLLCDGKCGT